MWRHLPSVPGGGTPLPPEHSPELLTTPRPDEEQPVPEVLSSLPMPDLTGLSSAEARELARQARLTLEVRERGTSEELWGRVLEQDPEAGASAPPSAVVAVTVGARPHITVPDVRGRDEDEALSMLRAAGLGAARRTARRSHRVPDGRIVRTRPRAGAEVPAGSHITYVVASGQPEGSRGQKRDRRRGRASRVPDGTFFSLPESEDRSRR